MTSPSLEDRLHDLRLALAQTRRALAQGSTVEFDGLDAEVERLTDLARTAPANQRSSVLEAMEDVLRELDLVADDLRRRTGSDRARQAADLYAGDRGQR
jgi:hypothetical protein